MNLKRIRKERKLTQRTLADISGVSLRMIQHYEQGTKDINKAEAYTIFKLAKTLECNMEDLIEWQYYNPDVHKTEEGCK